MKNITEYAHLVRNNDWSPAFDAALQNDREIFIPSGKYILTRTLCLPSHTKITADENALIYAANGCFTELGADAIITNADESNEDITVIGGIYDGNNKNNARKDWRNGPNSGLLFSFNRVNCLKISDVTVKNSETYHFRLAEVTDFCIENVTIADEVKTLCQDGIHMGGGCSRGTIRNVFARLGSPNDDLIAFNADDAFAYSNNRGQIAAPISDITVENVTAEDCWTAVRLLSIDSKISNITVKNLKAGVRELGLNLDATRYAGDKLFRDEDYPYGVGNIENVTFEDITLWRTTDRNMPLSVMESNCKNLTIKNFTRLSEKEKHCGTPSFRFGYIGDAEISIDGKTELLPLRQTRVLNSEKITSLTLDSYRKIK